MTRRIPISKCNKCVHHNGIMCVLEDLEPCKFKRTPEAENQRAKDFLLVFVTIFAIAMSTALWYLDGKQEPKPVPEPEQPHQSTTAILREYHRQKEGLTEFQMLTMAIALTESRFREDAVGTAGDSGVLQIRECYINEVNRLCGTDYTIEDAFDIGKSIEIFYKMQEAKNPSYNLDTAIRLHNKSDAYRQTVLRNLEEIKRYEKVREELTK